MIQRHGPALLAHLPSSLPPETLLALQQAIAGSTRAPVSGSHRELWEALTAEEAMIPWLEDLHWSDRSTLNSLHQKSANLSRL
jgi:hypothetical protein